MVGHAVPTHHYASSSSSSSSSASSFSSHGDAGYQRPMTILAPF
jgi:hypothetical protein